MHRTVTVLCLVCFSISVPAHAASQWIDVSEKVEFFPTPLPDLYGETWNKVEKSGGNMIVPSGKQWTYDLQIFQERIYIGHGSTNNRINNYMLYFDTKTERFDVDRNAAGKPIEFPEECMAHMRVFDGELYVTSTDQMNGGMKFFRKSSEGAWTIKTIHKEQQHSRDLYKVGSHILVHFSVSNVPFPGTLYSPDNGKTWTVLKATDIWDGPYLGYSTMFGFKGVCYMTRQAVSWLTIPGGTYEDTKEPWIVAFTGDPAKPIRIICQTPKDFHSALIHSDWSKPKNDERFKFQGGMPANLDGGITVGGKLLLSNLGRQLFAVESFEPLKVFPVAVTGCELVSPESPDSWQLVDMLERPDVGYLLLRRATSKGDGDKKTWTHFARVVKSTDAMHWTPVLTFQSSHCPLLLEEFHGDFYFGLSKSELLRVRKSAYSKP